ncbi:MAG: transposase [Clostridia bacterium]|nr:transposase [Clostridia bacterium]MBQ8405008.1 transposase [Clostridia bacterium]
MNSSDKKIRILMLITTPKLAKRAEDLYNDEDVPLHYHLVGQGTASSEMMDILGLDGTEKGILVSFLPKCFSDDMLVKLRKALRIGSVNSGIAFTVPLTGANGFVMKRLGEICEEYSKTHEERKVENTMTEMKYAMVAAVVDQGHSEEVMEAARSAGARGGTIIHGRQVGDETAVNFWGISLADEKEIVMIITDNAHKLDIMKAISKNCGVNSEAKGFVVSVPVETVIGVSDFE